MVIAIYLTKVNGTKKYNKVATYIYKCLQNLPSTACHTHTCTTQNRNYHLSSIFTFVVIPLR